MASVHLPTQRTLIPTKRENQGPFYNAYSAGVGTVVGAGIGFAFLASSGN